MHVSINIIKFGLYDNKIYILILLIYYCFRYAVHKNLLGFSQYFMMNVPPEYWSIVHYRATLAHKINHSFNNSNTEFGSVIHPRFGPIRSAFATKDIKRGEQLLIDYGYGIQSAIPRWFEKAYV